MDVEASPELAKIKLRECTRESMKRQVINTRKSNGNKSDVRDMTPLKQYVVEKQCCRSKIKNFSNKSQIAGC
ncbi:hypothetical protein Csa_021406 [Cucumis sativus]|uniref:Uncharacterized protein n=1 Tax=Cucumis sativus TaxID=3659 RepID=A0A0A0KLP7_CUCSA|nr:hypothetical protein Csa_021406 [Cucumis sativus]